jgi:ketosteroid isomerase-like protein
VFAANTVRSNARAASLLTLVTIALLCLSGCTGTRKEISVESTPDLTQAISDLRGAYAAFNRGDMDAAVEALDPHIEWTEPAEFPGGGTYHGRDGVKRYLTQSRAAWAEGTSQPERFITAGNRIVVFVYARVRPKGSNEWQDVRLADVYTVVSGKAVKMRAFADRQEALRWVGLSKGW